MTNQKNHFHVLDSWRGICACMVALFHFQANNHLHEIPLFTNAGLFVNFFFVLSGFVIFANYETKIKEGFGLGRFMFLRFGRLYPLHLATLLAFISVDLLQMLVPALNNLTANEPFAGPGQTPDYIVQNILLVHSFDFGKHLSFNWPSWSISAEFYTYLVFAVAILSFKNKVAWFNITASLLALVFLILFNENSIHATTNFGIIRCIYGFAAGAICWHIWSHQNSELMHKISKNTWSVIEAIVFLSVILFVALHGKTAFNLFAPVVFMLAVFVFSFESGIISNVLNKPLFRGLGKLSYSIYMNHAFIAGTLFFGITKVVENKMGVHLFSALQGKEKMGISLIQGDVLTFFYIIIVITLMWLHYSGQKMSKKIVSKRNNISRATSNKNIF